MAVSRGVWVVLGLIIVAVAMSAAGLVLMALFVGRAPQVSGNSTLVLKIGGDLPGDGAGRRHRPVLRSAADRPLGRRRAAQGQGRPAHHERRHPADGRRPSLWGKVQEIRDAIIDFRRSGKPIIAYLEYGGEQEFYLASACDKVFLMPTASLDLTGMASYELFLRGTLDKIGAYPDTLHIGEYKTASNTFTEHTFTPAHREMARVAQQRSLRAARRGHRRRPAASRRRKIRDADRSRPVPARGRGPRRAGGRRGVRGRARRQGEARQGVRHVHDGVGIPAVSARCRSA